MAVSHVEWTSRNVSQPRVALMASYEEAPGRACPLLPPMASLSPFLPSYIVKCLLHTTSLWPVAKQLEHAQYGCEAKDGHQTVRQM